MPDYDKNSHKERDAKANAEDKPKKKSIAKVVTGEVIQKPRTLGTRFKDIFLGGDARSAVRYVTADVLLPALRNMVWDMISEGTRRVIFPDSLPPQRGRPQYESRVQYNRYSSNPIDRHYVPPGARLPDQNPRWRQTNKQRIGDVVMSSREEAENVIVQMIEIIDQYEIASVADYYATLGLESTPIDNKWGWTYLNNVQVRQVRQGYVIDLPPVEEL